LADTLSPDDTLSPAQIAAANPKGIPQAVSTPGGKPSNIADDVLSDPRADRAKAALTSAYEGETRELSAAQRDQQQRDSQYRDRMDRMVTAEGVTADDLKPWNAQKELAEHKTDLWSQFGSPGFIIAMLGSAFTAQPMNSALQSGAAAMDAINAGDMKAYDKAFEAWKENSNLTIKRLDLEHQQIADIDHLRTSNLAEWRVQMETLLQKFGDERKLALLHNGYYPEVVSAQEGEAQAKPAIIKAQDALIDYKAKSDFLNGHPVQKDADGKPLEPVTHKDAAGNEMAGGDPRWYKMTDPSAALNDYTKKKRAAEYAGRFGSIGVMDKLREKEDVRVDVVKAHPNWTAGQIDREVDKQIKEAQAAPMTGNKTYEISSHLGLYDDATKIIDGIDETLNKYVGSAGLAGRAGRLGERIRDISGSHDTDRVQMMRDIEQLQFMAPQLLLDRTGRPLSAEHAYVESIIAGLNAGDTTANTLRAMQEIKTRLQTIAARDRALLSKGGGSGADPAPAAAPPAQKGWDDFPTVH